MAFRQKLNRSFSRKSFSGGAQRVHRKNFQFNAPMRGGIRL